MIFQDYGGGTEKSLGKSPGLAPGMVRLASLRGQSFPHCGPACAGSSIAWKKYKKIFHTVEDSRKMLPLLSHSLDRSPRKAVAL